MAVRCQLMHNMHKNSIFFLQAPLLMSVDLRSIRPEYKAILQNKKIIAVDQDLLGKYTKNSYWFLHHDYLDFFFD